MTRFLHPSRQKGAALALVLWAVFVMSTLVIVVIGLVDFDLDLEGLAGRRFEARQLALSGVALASHPKIKRGDPLLFQTFPNGNQMEVLIESEDSRININQILANGDTPSLVRLFRFWGVEDKAAQVAADCLKDWVDADDLRSLNGAEAADLTNSPYSPPENRPFLNVQEMSNVKGMDVVSRVKPDWMEYFSVASSGTLDVQSVSPDLLQVFGSLSPDEANAIVTYRNGPDGKPGTPDDPTIASVDALAAIVPLTEAQLATMKNGFGAGPGLKRIKSRGTCGKIQREISVVLAKGQPGYFEWGEK